MTSTSRSPHFKRYGDIENHTNQKTLGKIYEGQQVEDTGIWVALEKVHGCNFSFLVFVGEKKGVLEVRVAKRSCLLEEGEDLNTISTRKLIDKYASSALQAYKMVQESCGGKELKQITIFGELFGGHYPHPDVPKIKEAKLAQKGIYYHNDNDFYAFDIHDGEKYLDYDFCMQIFRECGFFFAEPLCTGTLKEILLFPNTFETTLPKHYGHPSLGSQNIAEGLVLKPIREQKLRNGKRVILKNKTEKYKEVKLPKVRKEPTTNLCDVDKLWEILQLYVTKNRLDNVKSHGEVPLTGKHCIGPLASDDLNEFLRDESQEVIDLYEKLPKNQQKTLKNRLSVACQTLIFKSIERCSTDPMPLTVEDEGSVGDFARTRI